MAKLDSKKYVTDSNSKMYCFASFPDAKVYKDSTGTEMLNHLLFGDYISIIDTEVVNNRISVKSRNSTGWINVDKIQSERVLEVNFIDIGQGDGCHIVTPDDQHILIDAGESDNMNRYLNWRFNLYGKKIPLPFKFKVVISHGDQDHYGGFADVFQNDKLPISEIYHNGIVDRPGDSDPFGEVVSGYIQSLVTNNQEMDNIFVKVNAYKGKGFEYPKVLKKALINNKDVLFKMLSQSDGYLNGFDSNCKINGKDFRIEVLSPICETISNKKCVKSINDKGKDKNGNSVMLKFIYGNVRILMGGDINEEFGKLIIDFYKKNSRLVILQADVAKSCHHGSNHFHYEFIQAVNSLATVISSGDEESFAHPRPDAVGALGKCGYSDKPMIFCTELARSNKEITIKNLIKMTDLVQQNKQLATDISTLEKSNNVNKEEEIKKIQSKILKNNKDINSFRTKYGMINLRTDGNNMIIAQKLEVASGTSKWDIHKMKFDKKVGRFVTL
jgi:beta-lactamase superfamily II metal-dependent hydrolase